MWKDKSPGLKILWLWTFGTAAVLVTNVVTTRMRDMEQQAQDQHQDQSPNASNDGGPSDSDQFIREEKP